MWGHLTYLGLLLPWAIPVLILQWAVGHAVLRRRLGTVAAATLLTTVYLVAADWVAISQGIWTIHADRILGPRAGRVPIEEALFFLLTDLMGAQSVVLLTAPEMRALASRWLPGRRRT